MKRLMRLIGLGQTEHEQAASLLSAYLDKQVSAGERALVEKHLRTCAACRNDLATLHATVQAVRRLPVQRLPRSFTLPRSMARQPRPSWAYPIFRTATAMVAALLALVMIGDMAGLSRWMPAVTPVPEAQPLFVAMEPTVVVSEEAEVVLEALDATSTEKAIAEPSPPIAAERAAVPPPVEAPIGPGGGMGGGGGDMPRPEGGGGGMGPGMGGGDGADPEMGYEEGVPLLEAATAPVVAMMSATSPTIAAQPAPPAAATISEPAQNAVVTQPELASPPAIVSPEPTPQAIAAQPEPAPVTPMPYAVPEEGGAQASLALLLRALEIGLAGLVLLLGALALVTSGRKRR